MAKAIPELPPLVIPLAGTHVLPMDTNIETFKLTISQLREYLIESILPAGLSFRWTGAEADIPERFLIEAGQELSRTDYARLNAVYAAAGYPYGNGDGSTTFNVRDMRGYTEVGKDDMGGSSAGRVTTAGSGVDGLTLGAVGGAQNVSLSTGNLPAHAHSIDHDHSSFTSGGQSATHNHTIDHDHASVTSGGPNDDFIRCDQHSATRVGFGSTAGTGNIGFAADYGNALHRFMHDHTHSVNLPNFTGTSGNASVGHTHAVDVPNFTGNSGSVGSGTAVNNMQPTRIVNFVVSY